MNTSAKILVIEDESEIMNLISIILRRSGFLVDGLPSATHALENMKNNQYDLIVLDWLLPDLSGIEFLKILRSYNKEIGVLMLTAKIQSEDIVLGLDAGADDYVTKPFENSVFLARVQTLLRRSKQTITHKNDAKINIGNLEINMESYEARCGSQSLSLTISEFKILVELAKNRGKVLTRDYLVQHVQGEGITVTGRTIDTHVFGLRKKLGICADLIETVRGIGYRTKLMEDL